MMYTEDEIQQLRNFWKKFNLTDDIMSELEKFWASFDDYPKVADPYEKDFSWNFRRDDLQEHSSQSEKFRLKLWIFVPLAIILIIFLLCHHYIKKSRNSRIVNAAATPVASSPPISQSSSTINSAEPITAHTTTPLQNTDELYGIRTASQEHNTEYIHGTSPIRPARFIYTRNHERSSETDASVNYERPIGFDVGLNVERPIGFDVGIDLESNSRYTPHNHNVSRTNNMELLPTDEPPPYYSVVSNDLPSDHHTFLAVPLRDSAESPPPKYDPRAIYSS